MSVKHIYQKCFSSQLEAVLMTCRNGNCSQINLVQIHSFKVTWAWPGISFPEMGLWSPWLHGFPHASGPNLGCSAHQWLLHSCIHKHLRGHPRLLRSRVFTCVFSVCVYVAMFLRVCLVFDTCAQGSESLEGRCSLWPFSNAHFKKPWDTRHRSDHCVETCTDVMLVRWQTAPLTEPLFGEALATVVCRALFHCDSQAANLTMTAWTFGREGHHAVRNLRFLDAVSTVIPLVIFWQFV